VSLVVVGPTGLTTTNDTATTTFQRLTGDVYCSLYAPDDGHEDGRNMLSWI